MDRKSIIVIAICVLLLLCWQPLVVNRFYPPKPYTPPTNNVATTNVANPGAPAAQPAATTISAPRHMIGTNEPEQVIVLSNAETRCTFSSRGGGLGRVELLRYFELDGKGQVSSNQFVSLNSYVLAPTLALAGGESIEGDGNFALKPAANGVKAEKTLTNGLAIVKEFQLASNYLITASIRLTNSSAQPLALPAQEYIVGTAAPMNARDNGQFVGTMCYNGSKTKDVLSSDFTTGGFGCIAGSPVPMYRSDFTNVTWCAAHNRFFALTVMPAQPALGAMVYKIELPRPVGEDGRPVSPTGPPPQGYESALTYPAQILAPGEGVQRDYVIYAGPKEYQTLSRIADRFNNNLDLVMKFGWASLVSRALLLGMNWMHDTLSVAYGMAIVLITFIIKVVFWPLTQASTRSMKRMQQLQPQLKELQEKYKDDPAKQQRKMMEFMKEHKVNPMGGCLPVLLQLPVFFGFYQMIQSAIELRGARFLWVADLSQPDTLFTIPGIGVPFNLLPLVMAATMLWQARMTPPAPNMDPAQARLMRYMPMIFVVFLYNYSAGLTLYWTVQNLLSVAQTKLTRTVPEPVPAGNSVLTAPQKRRK